MAKKPLTVLLIEDSSSYAELVQRWLSSTAEEASFVLNWTDSLGTGISRLGQGGVDVILLDLDLPDCGGMETFTQARARAPGVPIIVLTAANNEALALQMIREGAEDYLVKSECSADGLIRAVRYAVGRHESLSRSSAKESPSLSRVVGVMGAKGGVGTTTIACTLAAELRQQTDQKVLLADLDMNGGLASFLAGVESKYSILDAVANLDRLDLSCWESLVSDGPNGLKVMASPSLLDAKELRTESLSQVLAFATQHYDWTVLDLGRLNAASSVFLERALDLFVVTTTAVPALYSAKRLIDGLRTTISPDRIRLVVNHIEDTESVSRNELDSMFGVPIYATVPSDREELHESCVKRRFPAKGSKVQKEIASLTRKLTGLPEPQRGRALPSFLSFRTKGRKTDAAATVLRAG